MNCELEYSDKILISDLLEKQQKMHLKYLEDINEKEEIKGRLEIDLIWE